jgi:hypothetical protein
MPEFAERRCGTTAWLRLVRLPELLLAPGAPVMGFVLAGGLRQEGQLLDLLFVSLAALFAFGAFAISNDLADVRHDAKDRPLPSGEADPLQARIAACYAAFFALVFASLAGWASLAACAAILLASGLYNFKRQLRNFAGAALNAFRAAANVIMGAAAVPGMNWHGFSPELVAAAALFVYFLGVSLVAREQDKPLNARQGRRFYLFGALFCAALPLAIAFQEKWPWPGFVLCSLAAFSCLFLVEAIVVFKELDHTLPPGSLRGLTAKMSRLSLLAMASFLLASVSDGWLLLSLLFIGLCAASEAASGALRANG